MYQSCGFCFGDSGGPVLLADTDTILALNSYATRAYQLIGLILIGLGFIVAFGTMAWFGIGKAFGLKVEGITRQGPYKISRNPQILGGYLLVIGTAVQRPSLYALGWLLMYALIAHWMIITEEEHLSRLFGEEYQRYCSQVPRYLFRQPWRT
jgi:protein-S-isoprenylcysteine O-methyltransferase Ste14